MPLPLRLLVSLFLISGLLSLRADAVAPKPLLAPSVPGWDKIIGPNGPNQPDVSFATGTDGVTVSVQENGTSGFPGVHILPPTPWDISAFGRVDATVTNLGAKPIRLAMRVDDANAETGVATLVIKPNETQTLKVYLAYASQKEQLKASAISGILLFAGKMKDAQSFRINQIVADGPAGEKPPLDPKTVVVKPANGVIWAAGTPLDATKQIVAVGGAKGVVTTDGSALQIDFEGGKAEGISLRPEMGTWNLNDYFQLRVKIKNAGTTPVTPLVRIDSNDGPTDALSADAPIAPGQSAEMVIPFAGKTPWEGEDTPDMSLPDVKKTFAPKPGTGTKFGSHRVTDVAVLSDQTSGGKSLLVTSITAENPATIDLPPWLGQKPPVDGEWTKTFEDNFDGTTIDLTKWNIYAPNYWDTRTHFSKDNVIVKDGTLTLRVEKKPGPQNDDAAGKQTDYATGYADTYGKWV